MYPRAHPTCPCLPTATGPFFVDEHLLRSDIRADPVTGRLVAGVPLALQFTVTRVDGAACAPLTGAYLDVWHADAAGAYSDVSGLGTRDTRNATDGIFGSLRPAERSALTLAAGPRGPGYAGAIELAVRVA